MGMVPTAIEERGPTIGRKKKESGTAKRRQGGPVSDPFRPNSVVTLLYYIYSVFANRKEVENKGLQNGKHLKSGAGNETEVIPSGWPFLVP